MRFRVGVNAAVVTKKGKELFVLGEARATIGNIKTRENERQKQSNNKKMKGEDDLII